MVEDIIKSFFVSVKGIPLSSQRNCVLSVDSTSASGL